MAEVSPLHPSSSIPYIRLYQTYNDLISSNISNEVERGGTTTTSELIAKKKKDTLLSIMRGKEAINNQSRSFTRA